MPGENDNSYIVRKSISSIYAKNRRVAVQTKENGVCILRLIGASGDTVSIKNGFVYLNSNIISENDNVRSSFILSKNMSYKTRHAIERQCGNILSDTIQIKINQIKPEWKQYLQAPILKNMPDIRIFPSDVHLHLNAYNISDIYLPRKGDSIFITEQNSVYYVPLIEKYEGMHVNVNTTYTFTKNYVWLMCDNRDVCSDSRIFGPIPTDEILGIVELKL